MYCLVPENAAPCIPRTFPAGTIDGTFYDAIVDTFYKFISLNKIKLDLKPIRQCILCVKKKTIHYIVVTWECMSGYFFIKEGLGVQAAVVHKGFIIFIILNNLFDIDLGCPERRDSAVLSYFSTTRVISSQCQLNISVKLV